MIKSKDIFLSPSGDFGIGLVQDNLTNPNPHLGMSVEIFFNLNLTKGSLLFKFCPCVWALRGGVKACPDGLWHFFLSKSKLAIACFRAGWGGGQIACQDGLCTFLKMFLGCSRDALKVFSDFLKCSQLRIFSGCSHIIYNPNILKSMHSNKHCQRHNGPEG